ncbi:DUF4166 domain-containing protein [Leucobacter sp. NPDC058333]|uniref:DUF4166 domain-containing protein n=1 Tax=Leucobacter sp. NPDC058333 TaxID=3346450 RepID=UPI00365F47CE
MSQSPERSAPSGSPYARALAAHADSAADLHPTLQRYFATIPLGGVGAGSGTFERVGTSRRWVRRLLFPVLRTLQRAGIVWAGWAENVPFTIENQTVNGRAVSMRRFELPTGTWTMRDSVSLNRDGRLVDEIGGTHSTGVQCRVAAAFDLDVRDGGLILTSRAVGARLGRLRIGLPRWLAPVVRLREQYDDDSATQRVDVTIDAPLLGRIYEYGGHTTYDVVERSDAYNASHPSDT